MTTITETTNGVEQFESFSEADAEAIAIQPEDLEALEAEVESTLENVSFEDVAEDLEAYFEGDAEGESLERRRRRRGRSVHKRLLKIFVSLIKTLVKKTMNNPRTRPTLKAACRKGPQAVVKLLLPILLNPGTDGTPPVPGYLKWLVSMYATPIIVKLYRPICRQVGLKTEEVEATSEGIFDIVSTVAGFFF
jgi:hypothetical protein